MNFLWRSGDPTPIEAVRYVVLDTELTSLDSRSNRLLSLGAIAMDGARILLEKQLYRVVNPAVDVPARGVLIHGLRPGDIEKGEPPAQVLKELRSLVEGAVLVGHFVAIDLKILRKELGDSGHTLKNHAIDTARVQEWILRHGPPTEDLVHQLENLDLVTLAKVYGLEVQEVHHALADAFLTARLWQKMIFRLAQSGVRTLGALLRIAAVR